MPHNQMIATVQCEVLKITMLQVPNLLRCSFRDLKHGYWTNGSSHVPVCRLCTVYTSLLLKPK